MEYPSKPRHESITRTWGNMKFRHDFGVKIDNWLNQFEDSEKPMMLNLLKHFCYYTEIGVNEKVVALHNKFKSEYFQDVPNAIYTKIYKKSGAGFSDIVFISYWKNNGLYDSAIPNIFDILQDNVTPPVLVIIDDYFGTGNTFLKMMDKIIAICPEIINSTIYFLTIHGTGVGVTNIFEYRDQHTLNLHVISFEQSYETFKNDYIYPQVEAEIAKREYLEICQRHSVNLNYQLGYEQIQSLVAFEYNTPNNTLGIFWHSVDDFVSLFKRHQKQRTMLADLKQKAGMNRMAQLMPPIAYNIDAGKYNLFLVYCICWGKQFSITRACLDFGWTSEQLDYALRYIIRQGYIKVENEIIIPTEALSSHLFKSRIKDFQKYYYQLRSEDKIPLIETGYIPKNFEDKFAGYKE